jgi:sulfite reductase beta subunit-like hemoprotein
MNSLENAADAQQDIDHYQVLMTAFLEGRLQPSEFTSRRLLRGVYAQRQPGWYMVRTRLPGGNLNARQLRGLARAAEDHTRLGNVHLTTRQDAQLYYVSLPETPELLRLLAQHGISTLEAGGNTVRNVTICHLAGACPRECVDVQEYARVVSTYFQHHPVARSLPRKVKIAFSGCESDCARGAVHDLAFLAMRNADGQRGFRMLVGGGLGASPRVAVTLVSFLHERDLLPAIEAALVIHDRYSDRSRKTRSRMKFLVKRFGEEELRARFQTEFDRTRVAFDTSQAPVGRWRSSLPEVPGQGAEAACLKGPTPMPWNSGFLALPVDVPGGVLDVSRLQALGRILDEGLAVQVRVTQTQDLLLLGVPQVCLEDCQKALKNAGLSVAGQGTVVNCPGTDSCPLGITNARRMAQSLGVVAPSLRIGVSGCHNRCAWADVLDVGLIGKARRHHGKAVPSYTLKVGRKETLGFFGADIPAARVRSAVGAIHEAYLSLHHAGELFSSWSERMGEAYFRELLQPYASVRAEEVPFLSRDFGDNNLFCVRSAGSGECAAGQVTPVDRLLLNAAYEASLGNAFLVKQKYAEVGECLRNRAALVGRALLLAATGREEDGKNLSTVLADSLSGELAGVAMGFASLEEALHSFCLDVDEIRLQGLIMQTDVWVEAARKRCRAIQAQASAAAPAIAGSSS